MYIQEGLINIQQINSKNENNTSKNIFSKRKLSSFVSVQYTSTKTLQIIKCLISFPQLAVQFSCLCLLCNLNSINDKNKRRILFDNQKTWSTILFCIGKGFLKFFLRTIYLVFVGTAYNFGINIHNIKFWKPASGFYSGVTSMLSVTKIGFGGKAKPQVIYLKTLWAVGSGVVSCIKKF